MDDVILDKHTEATPPAAQGRAVKKKRKNSVFLNYLFIYLPNSSLPGLSLRDLLHLPLPSHQRR